MRYEGGRVSENVEFDRYVIFEWSHITLKLPLILISVPFQIFTYSNKRPLSEIGVEWRLLESCADF